MEPDTRPRLDWKFYVTLFATLAGVVVPIWLWRADVQARSLQLRVASQTSLEPDVPKTVSGLKLSVDGANIDRPFLTVLELMNDGSRPIPATDYEDSIQILVGEGARLIRTQITDVQPKDLQPKLSSDGGKLLISPLLLNPGDTMTLAIITAGDKPTFKVHARIAGIQSVVVEYRAARKSSATGLVVQLSVAFFLIFVYVTCFMVLIAPWRFEFAKVTLAVCGLAGLLGGIFLLFRVGDNLTLSTAQILAAMIALCTVAFFFALRVNRR
jgi:hypothetical protein